jgi:hypothetical protein
MNCVRKKLRKNPSQKTMKPVVEDSLAKESKSII